MPRNHARGLRQRDGDSARVSGGGPRPGCALDAYARVSPTRTAASLEAWQLLTLALRSSGPAADTRVLRFVEDEVRALGPNPGPDANWVMGLAFADVRGDFGGELAKAEERAPRSPRVHEARALAGGR